MPSACQVKHYHTSYVSINPHVSTFGIDWSACLALSGRSHPLYSADCWLFKFTFCLHPLSLSLLLMLDFLNYISIVCWLIREMIKIRAHYTAGGLGMSLIVLIFEYLPNLVLPNLRHPLIPMYDL